MAQVSPGGASTTASAAEAMGASSSSESSAVEVRRIGAAVVADLSSFAAGVAFDA